MSQNYTRKIKQKEDLKLIIEKHKKSHKKVAFTNGCFDLLHIGHVRYLYEAKALADFLVVAINSDNSVRKIKGEKRPITPQDERAEVIAALEFVDYVVIFDEPDPLAIISYLLPNVLIKGADWGHNEIIGREVVEQHGGKVVRIELTEGKATTNIIERIVEKYK